MIIIKYWLLLLIATTLIACTHNDDDDDSNPPVVPSGGERLISDRVYSKFTDANGRPEDHIVSDSIYLYDDNDRINKVETTTVNAQNSAELFYNGEGKLIEIERRGRSIQVSEGEAGHQEEFDRAREVDSFFEYDLAAKVATETLVHRLGTPNIGHNFYHYDSENNVINISGSSPATYTYDSENRITSTEVVLNIPNPEMEEDTFTSAVSITTNSGIVIRETITNVKITTAHPTQTRFRYNAEGHLSHEDEGINISNSISTSTATLAGLNHISRNTMINSRSTHAHEYYYNADGLLATVTSVLLSTRTTLLTNALWSNNNVVTQTITIFVDVRDGNGQIQTTTSTTTVAGNIVDATSTMRVLVNPLFTTILHSFTYNNAGLLIKRDDFTDYHEYTYDDGNCVESFADEPLIIEIRIGYGDGCNFDNELLGYIGLPALSGQSGHLETQ